MKKPRFQKSDDVEKCVQYLRTRKRASYHELSSMLGRNIKGRDRYVLESARRVLEREGVVFVVETGVGVVRANDAQVATLSTDHTLGKIKRTVKRAKKRQQIVNVQALSDEERLAFNVGRAVLGAIRQAAGQAMRNAVQKATADEQADGAVLSLSQTLDLFNKFRHNGKLDS